MKKSYPKVRFVLSRRTFNVLITALEENRSDTIPFIAKDAEKLCDKISKYARFFTDESGDECVDIRFYESEADLMIWQYINSVCSMLVADQDYYHIFREAQLEQTYAAWSDTTQTVDEK